MSTRPKLEFPASGPLLYTSTCSREDTQMRPCGKAIESNSQNESELYGQEQDVLEMRKINERDVEKLVH